ncbi:hypothetical protein Hanom_Chr15g01374211 [Helianthus anomalus]
MGLTLLAQSSLPQCFWQFVFETAVYLINRLPPRVSSTKSPFEHVLNANLIIPSFEFLDVSVSLISVRITTTKSSFALPHVPFLVIALFTTVTVLRPLHRTGVYCPACLLQRTCFPYHKVPSTASTSSHTNTPYISVCSKPTTRFSHRTTPAPVHPLLLPPIKLCLLLPNPLPQLIMISFSLRHPLPNPSYQPRTVLRPSQHHSPTLPIPTHHHALAPPTFGPTLNLPPAITVLLALPPPLTLYLLSLPCLPLPTNLQSGVKPWLKS